jgi:hypothetical protein
MNLIEREYVALQSHRVALRRRRDRLMYERSCAPHLRYGIDGYDQSIAMVEGALRGTERRWTELCLLLRKPLPGRPPVKLDVPAVKYGSTARSRAPGPYLNRMISSK